ncbi:MULTISPECIES: anti-sigma factor RsbA family regulatory protein [unclassified Blastococcus]
MTAGTGGAELLHAALFHDSPDELAAGAVPFLAAGLAAGEAAVLACRDGDNALLARELDADGRVLLMSREEVYTGSARALVTYRRLLRRQVAAGVTRIRLVCAVPVDQRPQQWDEWHRYEAVFNTAMEHMPLSAVCAYDRRAMSDAVQDGIEETHPAQLTPGGPVPNDRYVHPATVMRRTAAVAVDRTPRSPPTLVLADLADATRLPELRARLRAALGSGDGPAGRRGRFATAVDEVLGNAFRHGTPPVTVRLWTAPALLACTVSDCGAGFDDPLAGYAPPWPRSPAAGAGLWVARSACDTLETLRTPSDFTVRLATVLRPDDELPGPSARTAPVEAATARAERARAEARELARRLHARP